MRKIFAVMLLVLLTAAVAGAHNGHVHNILGTVKSVEGSTVIVKTTAGKNWTVLLTKQTKYEKARKAASRSDLRAGTRVSVDLANDSKTAVAVRIGAVKK